MKNTFLKNRLIGEKINSIPGKFVITGEIYRNKINNIINYVNQTELIKQS